MRIPFLNFTRNVIYIRRTIAPFLIVQYVSCEMHTCHYFVQLFLKPQDLRKYVLNVEYVF